VLFLENNSEFMTEIIFTRHGHTEWNKEQRLQGREDSPLTERGLHQASVLGLYLKGKGIKKIYSSSLFRAVRTSRIISAQSGISNILLRDDLREIYLSDLEGQQFSKAHELYPEKMEAFSHKPSSFVPLKDGETFFEAQKRAVNAVESIAKENPDSTILIVSHAVLLRLIFAHYSGTHIDDYWPKQGFFYPCSLSSIEFHDFSRKISLVNSIEYATMQY
jgi:broad specificity phosphatase PhoE